LPHSFIAYFNEFVGFFCLNCSEHITLDCKIVRNRFYASWLSLTPALVLLDTKFISCNKLLATAAAEAMKKWGGVRSWTRRVWDEA